MRGRPIKYPLKSLSVGEYFDTPKQAGEDIARKVRTALRSHRQRGHEGVFRVRTLRDEGVVRCERLS